MMYAALATKTTNHGCYNCLSGYKVVLSDHLQKNKKKKKNFTFYLYVYIYVLMSRGPTDRVLHIKSTK